MIASERLQLIGPAGALEAHIETPPVAAQPQEVRAFGVREEGWVSADSAEGANGRVDASR